MSSSSKIHIVAVPLPAQGHMSPMLHLCKFIARDPAFMVSFVNIDSIHKELVKHWEEPAGLGEMRLLSIPFSWNMPRGVDADVVENLNSWFTKIKRELPPGLENLIRELNEKGPPVRFIISDYVADWTQDVADVLGIPRIVLWSGCAAWTSLEYHIPELLERGHIFPSKERASADLEEANSVIVDYVGGITPLRVADLPSYMLASDEEERDNAVKRCLSIKRASWVLVNSFYDLEASTFDFMASELGSKFIPAGPIFLLDDSAANAKLRPENTDCLRWLDRQGPRSVLYISFGSIVVLSVEQFEELAGALEASKKPFLWVIRSKLSVVGGASAESYNGFLERTKDQGCVVSWAPQLRVLSHPSLGAFLTHCGWNSILESMSNGIPLLGWPYAGDQPTNCKLVVEDWKIGVRLSKTAAQGLIEREEIEAGIRTVMDSDEGKLLKERAEKLKSLAWQARDKQQNGLRACLEDLMSH